MSQPVYLAVTRFSTKTWIENMLWRKQKKHTGCVYGVVKPIPDKIPYGKIVYVIEMNNTLNKIMGVGRVRNIFKDENRSRIYGEQDYNRYVYKGNCRIHRSIMQQVNIKILEEFERILFKGSRHFKRGNGITLLPEDRLGCQYEKRKRKPTQCGKCGLRGHNSRTCMSTSRVKKVDTETCKKRCKYCGKLDKGHICTIDKVDNKKKIEMLRYIIGLFE